MKFTSMKSLSRIFAACLITAISLSSCVVAKRNAGTSTTAKHKGWSNPNNPHNPSPVKKNGKLKTPPPGLNKKK